MAIASLFMALGVLFLAGLAADVLGRVTRLPRVTLLMVLGLVAGPVGIGLLPAQLSDWFEPLSIIALTMVAFLLGGGLTRRTLKQHGRGIFTLSLSVTSVTVVIVGLGLMLAGLAPELALLLGAIAAATDPAAMADVIRQSGLRTGFTDTLKGIVAVDDAWGLIAFSMVLGFVSQTGSTHLALAGAAWDIGGGLGLGLLIGLPAAALTGRLTPGEPMQAEAIGIVCLTAGLALWLDVSFLIAGMAAGATIANLARHHRRAFHEIEAIQWPFMILFFVLAGASLEMPVLVQMGWVGLLYLGLRTLARGIGGWIGARMGTAPQSEGLWYGAALLPQAGVAVGMALVASETVPQWGPQIMAFTIASTVVFEILGPPITLVAIRRVARAQG